MKQTPEMKADILVLASIVHPPCDCETPECNAIRDNARQEFIDHFIGDCDCEGHEVEDPKKLVISDLMNHAREIYGLINQIDHYDKVYSPNKLSHDDRDQIKSIYGRAMMVPMLNTGVSATVVLDAIQDAINQDHDAVIPHETVLKVAEKRAAIEEDDMKYLQESVKWKSRADRIREVLKMKPRKHNTQGR